MTQKRINCSGLHTLDVKSSRILAAAVKRSEAIFTARSLEANATCFTEPLNQVILKIKDNLSNQRIRFIRTCALYLSLMVPVEPLLSS